MKEINYPSSGDTLQDKVILITGAGAGIGHAVTKACAAHGATIIMLDKNLKALESLYDEIIEAGYQEPLIYQQDLQKLDEQQSALIAQAVSTEFGRIDGIVHNAATLGAITSFGDYPADLWNEVFDVNVRAAFLLTKSMYGLLQDSKKSAVIFTTSQWGNQGVAYWGAYSVSNFAIEGMMQVLGDELESKNINVNAIDPGAVRTQMRTKAFPGEVPDMQPYPEQITDAYLYLLSNECTVTKTRVKAWHKDKLKTQDNI